MKFLQKKAGDCTACVRTHQAFWLPQVLQKLQKAQDAGAEEQARSAPNIIESDTHLRYKG
jgi:hypothetical protein